MKQNYIGKPEGKKPCPVSVIINKA